MTLIPPTINRKPVIDQFHNLMRSNREFRVFRLLGDAKLGKSHLATKVFPELAKEEYQARCAVLDLRSQSLTVPEILNNACALLGSHKLFQEYHTALKEEASHPKLNVSKLGALLSFVQIKAEGNGNNSEKLVRHLTTQFVIDIHNLATILPDTILILVFDQIDNADEAIQYWLMDTLLVQLAPLPHLRIVVAGRSVPEASGSYASVCHSYELPPVLKKEDYITFCRQIEILPQTLRDTSIQDFALAFDYKPGLFADYILPKFVSRDISYG